MLPLILSRAIKYPVLKCSSVTHMCHFVIEGPNRVKRLPQWPLSEEETEKITPINTLNSHVIFNKKTRFHPLPFHRPSTNKIPDYILAHIHSARSHGGRSGGGGSSGGW
ncbi:hypothetical protein TVAG_262340 [Trichomonas vaginalis G3]|uniref:Uncharacterized protein n=1 Tax=Trichomonas vaginalis (strain ATCC PRA-98 / G3) TaxID=412133 RepID=A2DUE6_TRIV3|nr:hypothetical protein TVAGG3_0596020 [Trichomonas vaginalis G3]EAY15984.1 hypothetical protein TVAG_262340 [Trichomonas vaginalis G3]KAI5523619.1 hypothetical protein TVAGG3_0596020 [Trichomonas vaginalis G3]|eukprot:XP_001328207.1 hypothetical protein [Trichomonas vaginalis G3]